MIHYIFGFLILLYSSCGFCMTITKGESLKTIQGPSETFTGNVTVKMLFQAQEPSKASAASVTFSPAARSHWHTHPMGQTLIVTKGEGRIQAWGEPVQLIKEGDVIWTPPGQKHWHGASPEKEMNHLAIQEMKDGKVVNWMEKVTDDQYNGKIK